MGKNLSGVTSREQQCSEAGSSSHTHSAYRAGYGLHDVIESQSVSDRSSGTVYIKSDFCFRILGCKVLELQDQAAGRVCVYFSEAVDFPLREKVVQ